MQADVLSPLYEPINAYKPFAPLIGFADGPFEYVVLAGINMPLAFTTRMTIVQLANGDLFLHTRSNRDNCYVVRPLPGQNIPNAQLRTLNVPPGARVADSSKHASNSRSWHPPHCDSSSPTLEICMVVLLAETQRNASAGTGTFGLDFPDP